MKDFFFFTKGERNGLCLLLALVCASIAFSANLTKFITPETDDTSQFREALAAFNATLTETPPQKPQEKRQETLQTQMPKNEHFQKKHAATTTEKLRIEINSADTTEFKKLRGIGSSFAARIVKFREKLGGFYSVAQIKEVYGISDELFASIQPNLTVNPSKIKKIALNDESFTFGFYHPYFPKGGVTTLAKIKKRGGRIERDSVKSILQMDDDAWQRLSHYLSE